MRINELISEQQDIDEGVGSFLGKAAGHIAGATGAAWRDAKQGYKDAKAVWDPKDPAGTQTTDPTTTDTATPGAAPTGGIGQPYVAPAAARTAPGNATTAPAPEGPDPKKLRQQAAELTQQADEIEQQAAAKQPPAPAGANAFGQMAGQLRAKAPPETSSTGGTTQQTATGQVHTASPNNINQPPSSGTAAPAGANAFGQMAGQLNATTPPGPSNTSQQTVATKQANAATSQQDAAIKAAADAAKAKPPFQQTLSDKNAIKAAAAKGIKEAKKNKSKKNKKVVAEFHSNFLGKII
jgi:hypothetical protein